MMKNKLPVLLRASVSLVLVGVLVWVFRKDIPGISAVLKRVNLYYYLAALLFNIAALVVVSERLRIILGVQKLKLSLGESVFLTFIGNFFNNFLPTAIGGDLVKAYYATKKSERKLESFSAVFFDRFFGFLSIGLLAFLGVLLMNGHIKDPQIFWGCLVFSGVVLVTFVLFLNKGITKAVFSRLLHLPAFQKDSKLRKLYNALNAYKEHKFVVAKVVLISLAAQVLSVVLLYCIVRGISQEISFLNLLLVMPLVSVAAMIPSINGLGVREGAFVIFLGEFISKESAAAVSVLFLGIILITSFIGGVLYLFSEKLYKIPIKIKELV
ncbi:MAG: lysylphosphatidylglycerol synthase transmembrane domain-containing protein [Candidatus Omnitrophica bacterium]|nr:lysylphosphatidylglycerol synthase transmembrane domain-containing protein [Candidatus Omnitrophota bacterium]